jgi:hypothetical protein
VLAVDFDVPLLEVPAPRSDEEHSDVVFQHVPLVPRVERDRALDGVGQVPLAAEDVLPRRRVRILEVGHVHPSTRVEGVDHHLPVAGGTGDLDATVLEVRRDRGDAPVALTDGARRLEEVGELAGSDALLALGAGEQELLPSAGELALERHDEVERLGCENARLVARVDGRVRGRAHAAGAPSNCASSVEPLSASVELSPPVTASSTASK